MLDFKKISGGTALSRFSFIKRYTKHPQRSLPAERSNLRDAGDFNYVGLNGHWFLVKTNQFVPEKTSGDFAADSGGISRF
jgi:hypothetical protein